MREIACTVRRGGGRKPGQSGYAVRPSALADPTTSQRVRAGMMREAAAQAYGVVGEVIPSDVPGKLAMGVLATSCGKTSPRERVVWGLIRVTFRPA